MEETNDLRRTQRGRSQSEYQIGLMIRGMETQLAEWEARIEPAVAATPSVRIAVLFTRVFLSGAPLLKLPSVKLPPPDGSSSFRADPARLRSVIPALHALYEYFLSLEPAELNSFIGIEWGSLILSVILGFRMSFPLAVCPEWDDKAAREAVRFGEYLDRLCSMGGDAAAAAAATAAAPVAAEGRPDSSGNHSGKGMDVLTASKIVLEMVKKKFMKRVAKLEQHDLQQQQQQFLQHQQQQMESLLTAHPPLPIPIPTGTATTSHDPALSGCPMMDGSLDPYYPYWDETFTSHPAPSGGGGGGGGVHPAVSGAGAGSQQQQPELEGGVPVPDDLWTAMTMGWAVEGGLGAMGMGMGLEGL